MQDFLEVFHASHQRALGNNSYNDAFIERFYDLFLSRSETVRQMFANTNMSAQKTMLHDSLLYMVEFFTARTSNDYMQRIAKTHSRGEHDVSAELYTLWLDSLVGAVKEFDPEFDDQVELAWRLVLSPGITYMQFMHDKPSSA